MTIEVSKRTIGIVSTIVLIVVAGTLAVKNDLHRELLALLIPGSHTYPSQVYVSTDMGGFQPGEEVKISSRDKQGQLVTHSLHADKRGEIRLVDFTGCSSCDRQMPQGDTVVRAHGQHSGHEEQTHINVDHQMPARPVSGLPTIHVEPGRGLLSTGDQIGTYFRFTGTGFTGPNLEKNKFEHVTLVISTPNGKVMAQKEILADKEGQVMTIWILDEANVTGEWRLQMQGDNGHKAAVRFYVGH